VCVPADSNVALQAAFPVELLTATAPQPESALAPSFNETVPPSGAGTTVAVNVTCRPAEDGFADEVVVDDVDAVLTVSVSAGAAEPLKLGSPEYVATIECDPAVV
jgi:hypothetical protein